MHLCIFAPMHFYTYAFLHLCILHVCIIAILHFCILVMYQNQVKGKIQKNCVSGTSSYTKGAVHHHIRKSRERIKGCSWLCVIFKNLGIDCYSNIFIAILNETLIRFLPGKKKCQGAMKNLVDWGNTVLQLRKCCLTVSVLKKLIT